MSCYESEPNFKTSITSLNFENTDVHNVQCNFCTYLNPNKVVLEFSGSVRNKSVSFSNNFSLQNLYDISFDSKKNLLTFDFSCGENPLLSTLNITEKSDGPRTLVTISGHIKGVDIVDILAQCYSNLYPNSPKFMTPSNPLSRKTHTEVTLFSSQSFFEDGKRHVKYVEIDFNKLKTGQTRGK